MAGKYRHIAEELGARILSGEYAAGSLLPTEMKLMDIYGVSRQTVRSALGVLKKEGLIVQKHGSGTFVSYEGQAGSGNGTVRSAAGAPKEQTVGVLCTYISNYIFPSIIRGIEKELSICGIGLQLASTENRVDRERIQLERFIRNPVDGLIVEGTKTTLPSPNIDLYRKLKEMGTKLVFIHAGYPELPDEVIVRMDDFAGGRAAVRCLTSRGHRAIAGIFKNDDAQGLARYAGFNAELCEEGLMPADERVKWYMTESVVNGIWSDGEELRRFLEGITGIVCYNDSVASDLVEARRCFHLTEPLEIVSFDKSPYAGMICRGLISLVHPKEELGVIAARKIIGLIRGEEEGSEALDWKIEVQE